VRKQLGIALEDLGFDEPWLVVDAIVSESKLAELPQTQVQYCEPARPCTYVVGVGRHRRWEITLLPGDSLSPDYPADELWPLLARWLRPGEGEIWRAAAYRFHGLVAREWRRNRILLAGDAAHMTPPFMAQGMVQGLRDALNLAWKLERVVRGRSTPSLLDTYERERRPHVVSLTRTAMDLGRVICERDPGRARERDERLLAEQGGEVTTRFRQDLIPGIEDGLIDRSTPGAGSLLPQPFVDAGGRVARLDDLTGRTVRVVSNVALGADERAVLLDALRPLDGVLVELDGNGGGDAAGVLNASEVDAVLAPWLAKLERTLVVARPDHHVYATAATAAEAVGQVRALGARLT
jgi:3-(3-hydroxy-phenyl)propionate hydroxylase